MPEFILEPTETLKAIEFLLRKAGAKVEYRGVAMPLLLVNDCWQIFTMTDTIYINVNINKRRPNIDKICGKFELADPCCLDEIFAFIGVDLSQAPE